MVSVSLKGLFKVTAKKRTYYYAWRGGPRIESEFGTPEFMQEFLDLRSPTSSLDKDRIGAWVTLYRASDDYRNLAPSTKRTWGPLLDHVRDHFGAYRVRFFERPDIRQDIKHWRNKWRQTPRMADMAKQVLSRVCSFMVDEGKLSSNPCEGIANLYDADRSDIIWTAEDIEALAAAASPEIAAAVRLAALTGLRQGDLLKLRWSQVTDTHIVVRTAKSKRRREALVPVTQELRTLLSGLPKRAMTVLTNTQGQPWRTGFGSSFGDALRRTWPEGRDLHFHDLRGTAATEYYRAGFNVREIAETLGWSEKHVEELIERYVSRDEIMRDRIRRLERLDNENRKTDSKTGLAR